MESENTVVKKRLPLFLRVILGILGVITATLIVLVLAGSILFNIVNRTNGSILTSGETRRYLLYVPETIDPSQPVSLVITFHGFAQWPANQANVSQWNKLAEKEGFIVVYPSGTNFPKRWRTSPEQGEGMTKDITFISDLIDQLLQEYNIDPKRVYANGLSNGGGMSLALGCELSERIAAIGGVGGAYIYPLDECKPARVVPMIAFHGTTDPIVPYYGGPSEGFDIPFPSIPAWIEERASLNGCDPAPILLAPIGDVSGMRYTDCTDGADVVFYSIAGGGHSWPGGKPLPEGIVGETNMDISATETIWEFFSRYTLNP